MKAKILIIILLLILIDGIIIMGIFHDRVVATRDKGLAVDWNADHKIQGNVDFRHYAAINMLLESRNDWPAGPAEARIIYRSDLNKLYIFDGADWKEYAILDQVAIQSGTHYWSCSGVNFVPNDPAAFDYHYEIGEGELKITTTGGDEVVLAPVFLPHGAVVTSAIVRGTNAAGSWWLTRMRIDSVGGSQDLATANINTEDVVIANATIDNTLYHYYFVADAQNGDLINGARIKYTL